jgi:methylglutaconyl-CoA hydratase
VKTLLVENNNGIFYVSLNRPDKKNSMNIEMIRELKKLFTDLNLNSDCKCVVLKGSGHLFSAGADLNWMQQQIQNPKDVNIKESEELFEMFLNLYDLKKPIITFAEKFVMGGALGLLACSDYVFAVDSTQFCFSETKLGLAPAVISPFILAKCDNSKVKPFMLFAEVFSASEAKHIGLVDKVGTDSEINQSLNNFLQHLSTLDLNAVIETKKLIRQINSTNLTNYKSLSADLISNLRVMDEAQLRIKKFLSKSLK